MKILVIEDQKNLVDLIKRGLQSEGFAVDYEMDGEAGQLRIELNHKNYDLIILDVMLPGKDGMEVCREVRKKNIDTPILMLTARDGHEDIINGLNAGADDYLTKPFSFEILVARVRALLRRPRNSVAPEIRIGDISLNPASKIVTKKDKEITLTSKEFSMLEYLMYNSNQVVSRDRILSHVWDFEKDIFSNAVDVHINNLRKKLGDKYGRLLQTVRGQGYMVKN